MIAAIATLAGLIATGGGIAIKVCLYLKAKVVEPLVTSHLRMIGTIEKTVKEQAESLVHLEDLNEKQAAELEKLRYLTAEQVKIQRGDSENLHQHRESLSGAINKIACVQAKP